MTNVGIAARGSRLAEFINSQGVGFDKGTDLLAQPESAAALLKLFHPTDHSLDKVAIAQIQRLRETILSLVSQSIEGQAVWEALNAAAGRVTFRFEFGAAGDVELHPSTGDPVLGVIILDVATLMEHRQWDRLKICSNEACSAAFFDTTSNKRQTWHSYAICGNKSNVAAHRSRRSQQKDS